MFDTLTRRNAATAAKIRRGYLSTEQRECLAEIVETLHRDAYRLPGLPTGLAGLLDNLNDLITEAPE